MTDRETERESLLRARGMASLNDMRDELVVLRKRVADDDSIMSSLRGQIDGLEKALAEKNVSIQNIGKELQTSIALQTDHHRQISALEDSLIEMGDKIKEFAPLRRFEEEHDKVYADMAKLKDDLVAQKQVTAQKATEYQASIVKFEKQNKELVDARDATIAALKAKTQSENFLREQLTGVTEEMRRIDAHHEVVLGGLQSEMANLKKINEHLNGLITTLQRQLADGRQSESDLRERAKKAEATLAELQKKVAGFSKSIEQVLAS